MIVRVLSRARAASLGNAQVVDIKRKILRENINRNIKISSFFFYTKLFLRKILLHERLLCKKN